jgi:hypothetical protein
LSNYFLLLTVKLLSGYFTTPIDKTTGVSIDSDAVVRQQIVKTAAKDLEGSNSDKIKVKYMYLSGGTEEYNETYQPEQPVHITYESTQSALSQRT